MAVQSVKELNVYQKAYRLAMEVFHISKSFPSEERYALISQCRRSSRSVAMNLREAWAKRRYEAHFVSKLTDCDGENSETDTSLDFALDCDYITKIKHTELTALNREVGRMIGSMLNTPEKFLITTDPRPPTANRMLSSPRPAAFLMSPTVSSTNTMLSSPRPTASSILAQGNALGTKPQESAA